MIYSKIPKAEILELIEKIGPAIPMDIVKIIGLDTTIIGAVLAELESTNKIKRTIIKKGSSPYYYTEHQTEKLEFLSEILKSKDRETFDLLKEHKILKSSEIDPLTRVSLQKLKDFAIPINVQNPKTKDTELYYQYFLATEEEVLKELKTKATKTNTNSEPKTFIQPKERIEIKTEITEKPKEQVEITYNKPKRQKIKIEKNPKQLYLNQSTIHKETIEEHKEESEFLSQVTKIFKEKNIEILDLTKIKKDEYDMEILQTTQLGKIKFFCKAKAKKKINEADLSIAHLSALKKHLPAVYISNGELGKKIEHNLEKDFVGFIYYKI